MWYYLIIAGLFGGLVGGMGLGGGTLLIPILTMLLQMEQHLAQGINLLVFIPTAIVALIIHAKNKLLDFKVFFVVIIPAIISSVICAILVKGIEGDVLRVVFGCFLVALAVYEIVMAIKASITNKKKLDKYKYLI
ncbi:MAG: sulfite exporter TauE/SafE family protein [Clostridia bacterium]|nr:sulfite exporter TauE/SafE family protein [Clostridia bacterium]